MRGLTVAAFASLLGMGFQVQASDVRAIAHPAGSPPTATGDSVSFVVSAVSGSNGPSPACFSADDRYVAFASWSSNLVPGQINATFVSVFLADLVDGTTRIVSRSAASATTTANGPSSVPALSADGRWVAYTSTATDLVAGQSGDGATAQVALFDRLTGANLLVSHASGSSLAGANGGSSSPLIGGGGRFVAFLSKATDLIAAEILAHDPGGMDLFLFDREAGTTTLVSHRAGAPARTGDGSTYWHAMSADGAFLAFVSDATDLVPGQVDVPGSADVFLFDRAAGTTTLLSRSAGTLATAADRPSSTPSVSGDGRFVAFTSYAGDLFSGLVKANGGFADIYCFDRLNGSTVLVSHQNASPVTTADMGSADPRISSDGSTVAYRSFSTTLVAGVRDTNDMADDIFAWDRASGRNTLASHSASDAFQTANAASFNPEVSADGKRVAFMSLATDLVPSQADTNAHWDVFLWDRDSGTNVLASRTPASAASTGNGFSGDPLLSADGNLVAFDSDATDLLASDVNGTKDAFVFRLVALGAASSFNPLPPCRLLDTRTSGGLLSLPPVSRRDFTLGGFCGVPPDAVGISVNVTVTNPGAGGFLNVFPAGLAVPGTSVVSFSAGQTRANNAILSISGTPSGVATFQNASGGPVDVIVDVNGFFR